MCTVLEYSGDKLTALLSGEIDHHCAGKIRDEIDTAIEHHHPACLVLDFGGVSFMDSSGIAVIINAGRKMRSFGGKLRVENPTEQARKVLETSGIERLIAVAINS